MACHNVVNRVNQSAFTRVVFPALVKLLAYHIVPIARFGYYNKWFSGGVSNFCAPGNSLICNSGQGKFPAIESYAAAGGNDGINGMTLYFNILIIFSWNFS